MKSTKRMNCRDAQKEKYEQPTIQILDIKMDQSILGGSKGGSSTDDFSGENW